MQPGSTTSEAVDAQSAGPDEPSALLPQGAIARMAIGHEVRSLLLRHDLDELLAVHGRAGFGYLSG
jgi:hypothetical protein